MPKRALVVGLGGLYGAYDAGVLSELGRHLPRNYFDAVYACSAGVFAATFFVAGQPETIENTWRNLVCGRQLVNYLNPLRGRDILDIQYLTEIFQDQRSRLDTERAFHSPTKITYVLTDARNGRAVYRQPSTDNWSELMRATAAYPIVTKPVEIDGIVYRDGGLADPLPVQKALTDGYKEIVAVVNKERGAHVRRGHFFTELWRFFLPKPIRESLKSYRVRTKEIEGLLQSELRIPIIRPAKRLPSRHILDTNKKRLNLAIDAGISDAKEFIANLK